MPCPQYKIFVKHKNCHFLQNKPVGSEIGQKCKIEKTRVLQPQYEQVAQL
jgi:hypothetical protein